MISSTPLRKSLGKNAQDKVPGSANLSPVQDETERRHRRSQIDIRRRVSNVPPASPSASLNSANVDVEDVKEHFKLCQKLFTENKITNKNAWNLKLIDYLKVLLSQDSLGKDTMLIAATSLDICTKVYACRVDDLHAEGIKLANLLTSLARRPAVEDNRQDNDDGADNQANEGKTPKKKKKQRRLSATQKHTIVKDQEPLLLSEIPKMPTTFFTGHLNIDASSSENMFTNKVPMNHFGHKIMLLDNIQRGWPTYDQVDPTILEEKVYEMGAAVQNIKICHAFAGFHIDEWDPQQEEAQIASMDKSVGKTNAPMNEELVYDEQGIPVAELDGSIHDIFADDMENNLNISEEVEVVEARGVNRQEELIVSFCPNQRSLALTDISNKETDAWIEKIWVGPSHWKNKFLKQRVSRFTGKADVPPLPRRSTKKRSKVEATGIDYDNPHPPFNFSKKYKCTRKIKMDVIKYTLPQNHLAMAPDPSMLMTKPYIPDQEFQAKQVKEEYEHSPYDYDNPNDSQYCSNSFVQGEDRNGDDPADPPTMIDENNDFTHEEEIAGNCCAQVNKELNMVDNLVRAPEMVTQTYIPYALRAKKMNMKKLKSIMWNMLTDGDNNVIINLGERPTKTKYSHLYKDLPSKLPESMQKELSPHLTFVALLHLTNEHNLKLTKMDDLRDFKIEQDKQA